MPYIIGNTISINIPGMWGEDSAYEKNNLHKIDGNLPPVNYDEHIIRSHSVTHIEAPLHVIKGGRSIDSYFDNKSNSFWGQADVIKLRGNNYVKFNQTISIWEISKQQIIESIERLNKKPEEIQKLLITTEIYPRNEFGYHDPNFVLILSLEAANFLAKLPLFNLYGTTWKSSDFSPGSFDRPIHKSLFKKSIIIECLDLFNVPEGTYFLSAFPLKIKDASESPLCPVLFTQDELTF